LAEVRTILDDIIQDDKRAGEVIRRIRTLVKKEAPLREAVALIDIIPETIALVRNASFLGGISIVTELDSELPSVQGDRVQLQQVILNLLLNATAAMKDTPAGLRKLIITTAVQDGQTVKVSVRDRGSGIDKNFMNRIFEPFYTTKADGLGMGLSISRTIIKAHGGTIWAENNGEGGATFYVTLPLYQGEQS
jgi:two-component system sensor kinase FixL